MREAELETYLPFEYGNYSINNCEGGLSEQVYGRERRDGGDGRGGK